MQPYGFFRKSATMQSAITEVPVMVLIMGSWLTSGVFHGYATLLHIDWENSFRNSVLHVSTCNTTVCIHKHDPTA